MLPAITACRRRAPAAPAAREHGVVEAVREEDDLLAALHRVEGAGQAAPMASRRPGCARGTAPAASAGSGSGSRASASANVEPSGRDRVAKALPDVGEVVGEPQRVRLPVALGHAERRDGRCSCARSEVNAVRSVSPWDAEKVATETRSEGPRPSRTKSVAPPGARATRPADAGERKVEEQQELPARLGRQRRCALGGAPAVAHVDLVEAGDAHRPSAVLDLEVLGAQARPGLSLAVRHEHGQRHDGDVGLELAGGRCSGRAGAAIASARTAARARSRHGPQSRRRVRHRSKGNPFDRIVTRCALS